MQLIGETAGAEYDRSTIASIIFATSRRLFQKSFNSYKCYLYGIQEFGHVDDNLFVVARLGL